MLIETDIIVAHIKDDDWLKPYAKRILSKAEHGELELYASRELIHEIYYVARNLGIELNKVLEKVVALTRIENIIWVPTTLDIDLTALTLMVEYNISSIFDAYHAATALLYDPDRTIISTDRVYDRIPGLHRIDPRHFNS
ncbi:MAG: VapC toxin family PIN domain ribonuclease [Thermoprotei archaeon]|nr:MAG: VapC toxin family PIN domain ribonuclease [Thermoprotei archaeon]